MRRHRCAAICLLTLLAGSAGFGFQGYPNGGYPNPGYPAQGYGNPYGAPSGQLRAVVNRTQNDLRYASGLPTRNQKGRERIAAAEGHLSSLDRKLSDGRMGRSELNKSIDKLRAILHKNVLEGASRNALQRDLDELLMARDYRG